MNLNCDVVLDMVSIYKDGAASESSRAAIDEHLKGCADCRRYYKQYDSINSIFVKKQDVVSETESSGESYSKRYADLSAALQVRRTISIVILAVCSAIAVGSIVYSLLTNRRRVLR